MHQPSTSGSRLFDGFSTKFGGNGVVAQEAAVAQTAVVLYREKHIPWETLVRFIGLIYEHDSLLALIYGQFRRPSISDQRNAVGQITPILYLRRQSGKEDWSSGDEPNDFLFVLVAFRACKTTEPRDKVFSLLGAMPKCVQSLFGTPDYTLSVESIYLDVARRIIRNRNNLDILSDIGPSSQYRHLPSWVPDWSVPHSIPGLGRVSRTSECYVHGLMKGEAMDMKNIPVQNIELK